jgi:hypothetical protein
LHEAADARQRRTVTDEFPPTAHPEIPGGGQRGRLLDAVFVQGRDDFDGAVGVDFHVEVVVAGARRRGDQTTHLHLRAFQFGTGGQTFGGAVEAAGDVEFGADFVDLGFERGDVVELAFEFGFFAQELLEFLGERGLITRRWWR